MDTRCVCTDLSTKDKQHLFRLEPWSSLIQPAYQLHPCCSREDGEVKLSHSFLLFQACGLKQIFKVSRVFFLLLLLCHDGSSSIYFHSCLHFDVPTLKRALQLCAKWLKSYSWDCRNPVAGVCFAERETTDLISWLANKHSVRMKWVRRNYMCKYNHCGAVETCMQY